MKMRRRVRIIGHRGGWTATVEGRTLGVIHHLYRQGARYHAPIMPEHVGGAKLRALEQALRENDLVVVQRDKDIETVARDGYVGVFRFTDLDFDPGRGLSLTLTERYADPLP
jgi:hypothetical protein